MIPVILTGIIAVLYAVFHKPREITYLSPEAFDYKMREIEEIRLDTLALCTSQLDIDKINDKYDSEKEQYKVRRR
jgi:hypothetical protein